jgi:DNA-binding NarL/FixJ family response regulator
MKVLLVQSDCLARSAFPALIRELFGPVETLATNDVVRMIARLDKDEDPDLLIAESHMARAFWFLASMETAKPTPSTNLVVWSAVPSQAELLFTLQSGALAYLPATTSPLMMRAALQMVMAGGRYFPHDLPAEPPVDDRDDYPKSRHSLTPRQAEVLALMSAGKSNKEIARELGMSTGTVKVHVTAILKALKVRNRTAAVVSGPSEAALFARGLLFPLMPNPMALPLSRDRRKA